MSCHGCKVGNLMKVANRARVDYRKWEGVVT